MGEAERKSNAPCYCGSGKKLKDCCLYEKDKNEPLYITVLGHSIRVDGASRKKFMKSMERLGCEEIILSREEAIQVFRDSGYKGEESPKFVRVFQLSQNAEDFFKAAFKQGLVKQG